MKCKRQTNLFDEQKATSRETIKVPCKCQHINAVANKLSPKSVWPSWPFI